MYIKLKINYTGKITAIKDGPGTWRPLQDIKNRAKKRLFTMLLEIIIHNLEC